MVSPLGHDFDNDEASCGCGTSWADHQRNPKTCLRARSRFNLRPRPDALPADVLRRLAGITYSTLASTLGIGEETARRALTGQIHGKGRTAQVTADRVVKAVHDMAGDIHGGKEGGT